MSKDFVVSATGERATEWLEVFGTYQLPVTSPVTTWASAPGIARAEFYMLDLAELTDDQRERLIVHTARKFGMRPGEVADGLAEHGMPLLAEGLSLTVYNPQRWLPDEGEMAGGRPSDEDAAYFESLRHGAAAIEDEDQDDVPFD